MDKDIRDRVCKVNGHHYLAVCLDGKREWKLFCDKCGEIGQLTNDAPQKTKVAA